MANYGLYKSINTSDLTSKASDMKSKMDSCKSELSSYESTLTDEIWKANAKNTLTTAFEKIENEVYTELEKEISKIEKVCIYIDQYKRAEENAKSYKNKIDSAKEGENTSNYKSLLAEEERKMTTAEQNVKEVCG